jgi:phospholipid/cholesterol/gamma-HCH transport system substrate-binding protein
MAMTLKDNLVEALIGAGVLVVAGAFVTYAYSHTERGSAGGYTLIADFPAAVGVSVGSDVRISGIKVGTVTSQGLNDMYQARLTLSIDPKVQLPIDTNAKIASEGLLGGAYIALAPGGDSEMLKNGEQIEQTQGSVDLSDLLGRFIYSGESGSGGSKEAAAEPSQ